MASFIRNRNIDAAIFVGLAFCVFIFLYALNFILSLNHNTYSNYISRIWEWSQNFIGFGALIAIISNWRMLKLKNIIVGLTFGIICAFSICRQFGNFSCYVVVNGIIVAACFIGATIIFDKLNHHKVIEFCTSFKNMVRSIGIGMIVGIPFSAINIAYFKFFASEKMEIGSLLDSAFLALNPGISEEIIFRYFVIAVILYFLKDIDNTKLQYYIAIFFGVVPHSLIHLPDLFIVNPYRAISMLIATSLLFGLPMALLQLKKNLESAIAFHWFIDFTRYFLINC